MRRAAVLTVALWLGLVGSAGAQKAHHRHHARPANHHHRPFAVKLWSTSQILALALEDGEEYWQGAGHHLAPCEGNVQFVAEPEAKSALGFTGGAWWSTWSDYGTYEWEGVPRTGEWGIREGPEVDAANFRDCVMHYVEATWPSARVMTKDWPALAYFVAHEEEHLENRWWVETPVDNGTSPIAAVCAVPTAVNCPYGYNGSNEPQSAKLRHPAGS